MVRREQLKAAFRVGLASLIAPALPSLVAFAIVSGLAIRLPDKFGHQVFLVETVMFYVAALPGFLILHAHRTRSVHYALMGMFATWPLWLVLMLLPSDASVAPLNPQFFFAPTTATLGLMSGLLFFVMAGKQNRSSRGTAEE